MNKTGAQPSRRAVLRAALRGLALAAIAPRTLFASARPEKIRAIAFVGSDLVVAADAFWRRTAGEAEWRPLPGAPGEITSLASHPDRARRVFAGTASGGVMISRDGGAIWTGAADGLPGAPVTALAVAAHAPDTLYAAVEGDGLWTSQDAGASWTFAMDRPYRDGAERELLALASVNAETGMGGIWIYAGTESGVTRLPDCFCRWQDAQPGNAMDALAAGETPPASRPLPRGKAVRSLAVAPREGSVVHAALPSGIWKSTDAGVNWARLSGIPARLLAVDPASPEHLVAVAGDDILTSRDGGTTWTALAA